MKIYNLSALLFFVGYMALAGLAHEYMIIVSGTAVNGGGAPIKQGAEIPLNRSAANLQSTVTNEDNFSPAIFLIESTSIPNRSLGDELPLQPSDFFKEYKMRFNHVPTNLGKYDSNNQDKEEHNGANCRPFEEEHQCNRKQEW